jgi:hypothetical protein
MKLTKQNIIKLLSVSSLNEIEVNGYKFEFSDLFISTFFNSITLYYKIVKMPSSYFISGDELISYISERVGTFFRISTVPEKIYVSLIDLEDNENSMGLFYFYASNNILEKIDKKLSSIHTLTIDGVKYNVSNLNLSIPKTANVLYTNFDLNFYVDNESWDNIMSNYTLIDPTDIPEIQFLVSFIEKKSKYIRIILRPHKN